MQRQEVRLAFQRAGTTQWVEVDPHHPDGQRMLAVFTHPKENVMTTTAGRINSRPTTTIIDPETGGHWVSKDGTITYAGGGIVARVRGWFRGLWASVKSGWARISEALHLDAVTARVRGAYAWTRAKVAAGMRMIGTGGGAGLAMLGLSTSTGRQVLGFLLRPIGWLLEGVGTVYCWVEETIDNDGKGGIRTWVTNGMVTFREFLFGNAGKDGVIPGAILWVADTFGRHLLVDSFAMRTVRAAGSALTGRRLGQILLTRIPFIAGIPFIGAIAAIAVFAFTLAPFSPEISKGYNAAAGIFRSNAKAAHEIVDHTAEDIKATTATAAAMSAGNAPVNREVRRSAKKASTRRPR